MARVGRSLLQDSKAALRAENGKLEKNSWKTRDLLSVLLRANMATDLPPSQRMVDEDVISREYFEIYASMMDAQPLSQRYQRSWLPDTKRQGISTFIRIEDIPPDGALFSTATTRALQCLCLRADIQTTLREELFTISTDNPTMDELNSLPYLDAFVREVLRLYAPVSSTVRMANRDDIIPLAAPVRGKNGRMLHEIPYVTYALILFRKTLTTILPE